MSDTGCTTRTKTYEDQLGQTFWVCPECEHHSRDRSDECYNCGHERPKPEVN